MVAASLLLSALSEDFAKYNFRYAVITIEVNLRVAEP